MAATAQQGFVDPYSYSYPGVDTSQGTAHQSSGSMASNWGTSGIPGWLMNLAGFDQDKKYNELMTARDQQYERASIESARAWSEYMDNTQIQRRVKDIEAAGLNPWLAVQSGVSGSGAPSADTGGSARNKHSSGQSKSGLAMLLMALAKILG